MKEKYIHFNGVRVYYTDRGTGPCLVFLHGYLESMRIWDRFLEKFPGNLRLISIDLPGHGKSGIWGWEHSMEDLAGAVHAVAQHEAIGKLWLVGHSMGGYVTMAFAALYSGMLNGYVLFHSTCFADNDEKRLNREREISLVECGKKRQIIMVNIPKAFADQNVDPMAREVSMCRELALESPDRGIIALLNGMKNRQDRCQVLSQASLPVLLICGKRDNYIPGEVFERLAKIASHAQVLRLANSGHMGFLEEPDLAAEGIIAFVSN